MRELCYGGGGLVKRGTNSRVVCPECGRKLAATTSPVRRAQGLYLRIPNHYRQDRDDLLGLAADLTPTED
jgi:hypothetical protein